MNAKNDGGENLLESGWKDFRKKSAKNYKSQKNFKMWKFLKTQNEGNTEAKNSTEAYPIIIFT